MRVGSGSVLDTVMIGAGYITILSGTGTIVQALKKLEDKQQTCSTNFFSLSKHCQIKS